jgi:tetratricopeptide (TPR) repeat protein
VAKPAARTETAGATPPALPKPVAAPSPAKPAAARNAASYHALGRELIQQEKFADAIQALTQAIQINPALPLAYNARGYAHFRLKQFTEAIADFDQAIQLDPKYGNAYLNRGSAKRAAGDKPGGDEDLAKARGLTQAKN